MYQVVLLSLMAFCLSAHAKLLVLSGAPVKKIHDVPVYPEAKVETGASDKPAKLGLTGAGLREKKVVFLNVNVYVAASYAENPKAVTAGDALQALKKSKVKAIDLTMLRKIPADKMRDAIKDSLKENDVDPDKAPVKEMLSHLTKDLPEGSHFTVVGVTRPDGTETVTVETADEKIEGTGKDLAYDYWKIWFGKPTDGGLERLKPELEGKQVD